MFQEFIKYYLVYLVVLVGFVLVGYFFLRLVLKSPLNLGSLPVILGSATIGLLAFVLVVSCYFTNFKTVNIIFFPLLVMLFVELKRKDTAHLQFQALNFKDYIYLLIFTLIFFSIGFFRNVKGGEYLYRVKSSDNNFYSEVAQFLQITGQENIYNVHNLTSSEYWGTTPYHYLEIWFGAGLSSFTGLNNLLLFYFTIFPFFYFLVFLVIAILIDKYQYGYKRYIYSFLLLFVSGLVLELYMYFFDPQILQSFFANIFFRDKLSSIYVFIGLFIFQVSNNVRLPLSFFTLLFIPITCFTTLPAIYGGVLLFCITYNYHRLINREDVFRVIFCTLILCFCFTLFYLIFGNKGIPGNNSIGINLLPGNERPEYLIRRLYPFVKVTLAVGVAYFPYVILILLLMLVIIKQKNTLLSEVVRKNRVILLLFLFTSLMGIGAWALLYYSPDSFQLSENFSGPYFSILLIMLIVFLFSQVNNILIKSLFSIYFYFLIVLNITYTFYLVPISSGNLTEIGKQIISLNAFEKNTLPSDDFLISVKQLFDSGRVTNYMGVSITDSSEFLSLDDKSIIVNRKGDYLKYFKNGIGVISISDYEIPLSKEQPFQMGVAAFLPEIEKRLIESSSFYRYVQSQVYQNKFKSIAQSQIDFIKHYKIQFMISTQRAKTPSLLVPLIDQEWVDKVTGQRFILFKKF